MISLPILGKAFLIQQSPKRAMLQAGDDLTGNTTNTSRKEDERCQRLDKCCERKEAAEHACRKPNEKRKGWENRNY